MKNLEFWKVKLLLAFCYLLDALICDYYTPTPSGSASVAALRKAVDDCLPALRLIYVGVKGYYLEFIILFRVPVVSLLRTSCYNPDHRLSACRFSL